MRPLITANFESMGYSAVDFSIISDAAWAPGIETREAWQIWAQNEFPVGSGSEPPLRAMSPMQRRRLGLLGKMALEVAYECLGGRSDVPIIFCSRHGEASRSVDLLRDLATGAPLSPTSFGLSVHNAIGGMFSIARKDHANHIALSARQATVEHAVIEACGLLADGEKAVLLVTYDYPLPEIYAGYRDGAEQPFAWAWLLEPPRDEVVSLSWSKTDEDAANSLSGLEVLRFYLRKDGKLKRRCGGRLWQWIRNV